MRRMVIGFWLCSLALWPVRALGVFVGPDDEPGEGFGAPGSQQAFLVNTPEALTLYVQPSLPADLHHVAWVLPLPVEPDRIEGAPVDLFRLLDDMTAPHLVYYTFDRTEEGRGCALGSDDYEGGYDTRVTRTDEGREAVEVLRAGLLEDQLYAVVRAATAGDLTDWLRENAFHVPAGLEKLARDYVRDGFVFLAVTARATPDPQSGPRALAPLAIHMPAETPLLYPMRLTALVADDAMPLLLFVASMNMPFIDEADSYHEINQAALTGDDKDDPLCDTDAYGQALTRVQQEKPGRFSLQFRQILNPHDIPASGESWLLTSAGDLRYSEFGMFDDGYAITLFSHQYTPETYDLITRLMEEQYILARWYAELSPGYVTGDIRFREQVVVRRPFTRDECKEWFYITFDRMTEEEIARRCDLKKVFYETEHSGSYIYQDFERFFFMFFDDPCQSQGCRSIPTTVWLLLPALVFLRWRRQPSRS